MTSPSPRLLSLLRRELSDLPPSACVLVAASGGADSTALLHLLPRAFPGTSLRFMVLHLDHGLRPDSTEDASFVAALAERLGMPSVCQRAEVAALACSRRLGLEEAGRHARYSFFAAEASARQAAAVLLAHTRDDQAETVLLRLVRGSGTKGLAAMRPLRDGLYRRPLLGASRARLRGFLAAIGETWREDPSQLDLRFARNRLRLDFLPRLAALNPRIVQTLARTALRLGEDEELLSRLAAAAAPAPGPTLDSATLAALPPALARRVALAWLRQQVGPAPELGHWHVDAVLALAKAKGGQAATDVAGNFRLRRRGHGITLRPRREGLSFSWPLAMAGRTLVPELGIELLAVAGTRQAGAASGLSAWLPLRVLGPEPRLRSPRSGDRFQPLGGPGSRPLRRYLMDRRIPLEERSRVALLEGRDGILWVVGHQIAEAARLEPGEPILELEARKVEP